MRVVAEGRVACGAAPAEREAGALASEIRDDTVVFTVEDDGVGGDFTVSEGHGGMLTMRARALAVSATLTSTSQPDGGTVVSLEIPRQTRA